MYVYAIQICMLYTYDNIEKTDEKILIELFCFLV